LEKFEERTKFEVKRINMKIKSLILVAGLSLYATVVIGGDLTVDGNLNVTNKLSVFGETSLYNQYSLKSVWYDPYGAGGSGTLNLNQYSQIALHDNSTIIGVGQGLRLYGNGWYLGSGPNANYISFFSKGTNITHADMLITNGNVLIPTGKFIVGPIVTNVYPATTFLSGGVTFFNKYSQPAVGYEPESEGGLGALHLFHETPMYMWGNARITAINTGLKLDGSHPFGGRYINFFSKTNSVPDMQLTNGTLIVNGSLIGKGQVRIVPQGDLSMGTFTNSPPSP
jgi:hypothetical protein